MCRRRLKLAVKNSTGVDRPTVQDQEKRHSTPKTGKSWGRLSEADAPRIVVTLFAWER
jgi:hypothetical protein